MKILLVLGLAGQLSGAWFLCRVFFRAFESEVGQIVSWRPTFTNREFEQHLTRIGNFILWAKGLPWEERVKHIKLVADPNATFAFILIALGTILQTFATLTA